MKIKPDRDRTALWASGLAPATTGLGVFQRQIYPRLSKNFAFDVRLGPAQERTTHHLSRLAQPRGIWNFVVQIAAPVRGQVAFLTTTPTPVAVHIPVVGVVYDLRWVRTRGPMSRFYRRTDLARLVRLATSLIAISDRTRSDLLSVFPEAGDKTHVIQLGPGNIKSQSFSGGESGTVLLIGSRPHKRNELAAGALARARPPWARHFIGLNVSPQVKKILEGAFGADNCKWFSELDAADVEALYKRAETFICLSLEEGFGLPFTEALASGCGVVAIRQPLTEAILADSAVLLENGGGEQIASQLARISSGSWPTISKRKGRAAEFSWDAAARNIAQLLHSAVTI